MTSTAMVSQVGILRRMPRAIAAGPRRCGTNAFALGTAVVSSVVVMMLSSDGVVATRRAEDDERDQQTHDREHEGDGRAVAEVAVLERRAVHVHRQRRGRVAGAAAGEGEDRVEDL